MTINAPTGGQVPALRTLWREAFGDTEEFLDAFTATAMSADRCRVAVVEGQVAAALYWFDCSCQGHRLAYIYAVATGKAFRGRGICHRLMEHTHAHLLDAGYAGSLLVPGDDSLFHFYETMGYRTCTHISDFPCASGDAPVQLYPVDKAEYARLRRQLLPPGGVVQEGENLDFLATQARLYAGTGFVLAAQKEGQTLTALELLGDKTAAPGILTALGCSNGTFRVPGTAQPFAMYRPLTGAPAPSYFAFAFD